MANQRQAESSFEPWARLENKVVMVTGASSGLGWEFCLDLAKAGCRIVAAARRIDRLRKLCDLINSDFPFSSSAEPSQAQPRAVAHELDLSAEEPIIEASVKAAWDIFGRIDALVNNGGVRGRIHGPMDLSEDEWNSIIKVNQTGVYLMSKHMGIRMRESKEGGSIINISSITGLERVQFHGGHAYSASKHAVRSITKVMALEFGAYNIRVNSIAPGLFPSEITQGLEKKYSIGKVFPKLIPLGFPGTVNPALTSLIRYLIHDSSQYVTGNIFIVDAGTTLPGVPIFSSL